MKSRKAYTLGSPNVVLRSREVPDPHMTDAEYLVQLGKRPDDPAKVGKVIVLENAMSRIGALCWIERTPAQERAAEVFKATYESLYGAQPAMDMSNPVVDTSPIAHDSGMAARIDRSDNMRLALKALGRTSFNRIVASVCMGISFRDYHWRKRKTEVAALLQSLDTVAGIWKLKSRDAA